MAILVVNYPNIAPGTELEVQGYGVFKNGTSNEVIGPLYQSARFRDTDDDGVEYEWFEAVEVQTLILGEPLNGSGSNPGTADVGGAVDSGDQNLDLGDN